MALPRKWIMFFSTLLLILAVVMISFAFVRIQSGRGLPQTSTYEGTALNGEAPDFQLIDQHGTEISLSDFRGNIVVLAFMDSTCVDVCPLISLHLRTVYQQLTAISGETVPVVFIGVNVNAKANSTQDVFQFTVNNGLFTIPTWHFLTGSLDQMKKAWDAYSITVVASEESAKIIHTPGLYLIDENGEKAWYVAVPVRHDSTWQGPSLSELLENRINDLLRRTLQEETL